jgi:hypothetical protein
MTDGKRDGNRDGEERFDGDAWRKRLGTGDFEERERAFDQLARLARHDEDARKAIEEWSKSGQDPELAWTSRMLLRELDRNPWRALKPKVWSGMGMNGQGWNFDFDDFARRFDDLDSMFGDLREQWGDMLQGLPAPSAGSKSSSRSLSLQVGPDGVTCNVTEIVDGKEEKRTYEAKSMDELLQAHPELRENLGGPHFQLFQGLPHGGLQFLPRTPSGLSPHTWSFNDRDDSTAGSEPPTDRLGIKCAEVGKDRATELGLESGVGLTVQEVLPGTIASLLGLRHGDIVVEVNGANIHGAEDVKSALSARASEADVSVVVVGADGHRRKLIWKPKPAAGNVEKKTGSRKL